MPKYNRLILLYLFIFISFRITQIVSFPSILS
nr:MAG TPA: hypothetical protein [Caudoviricetes sp.]